MKKILVLLAACVLSAGVASAQVAPAKAQRGAKTHHTDRQHQTPEQKADQTAKRMSEKLNLSAAQTAQVRQLQLTRYQTLQAKRTEADKTAKSTAHRQEMKASQDRYDAQLKQILNADQYAKYAQQKAERLEKHKAHRKAQS